MKRSSFLKNLAGIAIAPSFMSFRMKDETPERAIEIDKVERLMTGPKLMVLRPDSIEELGYGKRELIFTKEPDCRPIVGNELVDEYGKNYYLATVNRYGFPEVRVTIIGLEKQKRKNVKGKEFVVYANAYPEA